MRQHARRHQRARIEADRAARDQVAPAQRDEIGRAGPGADEMHGHGVASVATLGQRAGRRPDRDPRQRPAARPARRPPAPPPPRRGDADQRRPRAANGSRRGCPRARDRACATSDERHAERRGRRRDAGLVALWRRGRRDGIEHRRAPGRRAPAPPRSRARSRPPRRPPAADARDDHGFTQRHCVTGIAGRQAVHAADRLGARDARCGSVRRPSAHSAPAAAPRVSSVTALTTSRPPARSAASTASSTPGSLAPPPMKTASGGGSPASAAGAVPCDDRECPARRGRGVARDARRALRAAPRSRWRAATDRPAAIRSPTEPAPAPMSHSSSPRRGASADSVTRAHFALGDLAVMLEQIVGQTRRARDDAGAGRRRHLDRDRVERIDVAERRTPPPCAARMRSRGPPSASSTVRRDAPKPRAAASAASAAGVSPSEDSASTRAPGCRCGRTRSSARPCRETSAQSCSAQPSRAAARLKAEGAGTHHDLGRLDMARQHARRRRREKGSPEASTQTCRPRCASISATPPRTAIGQGRAAPRMSAPASARWRAPPNTSSAPEMRPRATAAQALDAVLADADDGQPAGRCGMSGATASRRDMRRILILGGTTEARELAAALGRARRSRGDAVARRPHRRAGAAAGAGAHRRLRRRRGLADYLATRAHRRADRRHASVRRQMSANAAQAAGRAGVPLAGAAAAALERGRGRSLERGRRCRRRLRALGEAPRRVFLALGRNDIAPFVQAPQHHYLVRSVDPVEPPLRCRTRTTSSARGPFAEADDWRCSTAHRIETMVSQEQRRRRHLRQDRGGARARPRRHHAAPAGAAARSRPWRRSRKCWPGSIMRARLAPSAGCRPAAAVRAARSHGSRRSRR